VVGFVPGDLELVADVIAGLGPVAVPADGSDTRLAEFNDRLLAAAGGSRRRLPGLDPDQLRQRLARFADEARQLFADVATEAAGARGPDGAWVWADPALSVLSSFWAAALDVSPALVLVHRPPEQLPSSTIADDATTAHRLWAAYNRAGLVEASERQAMVVSRRRLGADPKGVLAQLAELLGAQGGPVGDDAVDAALSRLESATSPGAGTGAGALDAAAAARPDEAMAGLGRLLERLEGVHLDPRDWPSSAELVDVDAFYDDAYYGESYDRSGIPYSRDEPMWVATFGAIADRIVETMAPATVLDVGCAIGLLVEALRDRGVDARGVDVSPWAISQVPPRIRPFCSVGSVTDELEGHVDLITCIEVVEHLPPFNADAIIGNLCRHADAVLLSSTPDDFDEETHLNVRSSGYWSRQFLHHGFVRVPDADVSFVARHAVLYRRQGTSPDELVDTYERAVGEVSARRFDAADSLDELRRRLDAVEHQRTIERMDAARRLYEFEVLDRAMALRLEGAEQALDGLLRSRTFRYSAVPRRLYTRFRQLAAPPPLAAPAPSAPTPEAEPGYDLWVELYDTLDDATRQAIARRVAELDDPPLISVLVPTYNTPEPYLREVLDSVRRQIYPHWELCVADDRSTQPHVAKVLDEYAELDPRIKVVRRATNGHIAAASNSGLELATGAWVALVDHDDRLADHALALSALAIAANPEAGIVYSDEDKFDESGRRHSPYFKPEFDPLLLLGQNFVSHLSLIRRDLLSAAGGFREGLEGSQDWDLVLRVSEHLEPSQVVHVPHVLYHWRAHDASTSVTLASKPYASDAGLRAVREHLARSGRRAQVRTVVTTGYNRVQWEMPEPAPRVTIVVPTRDGRFLRRCVDSVLGFTTYPDYEVLVIDNGSVHPETIHYLDSLASVATVVHDDRPFNYSALNNMAVRRSSGDAICLLNDDTEVFAGEWLTEMVSQLVQPQVGAVGAKLLYENNTIQHAGVGLGVYGVAGHLYRYQDRLAPGYMGRLLLPQSLSAVTAACMLVRRSAWEQVGGLEEEHLAVAFNDVDFCLRVREAGWRIVWTPYAELVHHESITRGSDAERQAFQDEIEYMKRRWGNQLRSDPAYNPNLSLASENCAFAFPPRVAPA
jgi:GT2 family glycosyltransferase